jgi:hypothetical protein
MFKGLAYVLAAFPLLAGCAIHPVPEDVAGVDTYHIVRQIRCEARETLRRFVITWLEDLGSDHGAVPGDPIARRLAQQYVDAPESVSGFKPGLFPGRQYEKVRAVIDVFYNAGIAYTFDFTMSEDNDLSTEINLLKPITRPKFTLGISAGAKRQRTNNRLFTVTDTFSHLLTRLNAPVRGKRYCDGQIVIENYAYPIAGRIGVDKLMRSFIEITLFANLAGKEGKAGAMPTMADKLTFTTRVNLSATPKVEFTPIGEALQLANASVTGAVVRNDVHQVTVALALDPEDAKSLDPLRDFLFSSERGARIAGATRVGPGVRRATALVIGRRVTGGGTPAEQLAVTAIDQLKSRELEIIASP